MNALSPLGWAYGLIQTARNSFYDRGVFKTHPLGVPTISIGNLTTGGTGKTPMVAYAARLLADSGEKVCILTRGYGRENVSKRVVVSDRHNLLVDAKTGGDEPVELARKLIGKAKIIADRDRVAAARWALQEFNITTFLLDDGFQHRRAERDLDIVCVDATNPFGNGEILPAGILRESLSNLRRADAVVITRANLADGISDLKNRILALAPEAKLFVAENKLNGLASMGDFNGPPKGEIPNKEAPSQNRPAFAFCGLGNPSNFFHQLAADGFNIVGRKTFGDHHYFDRMDVLAIEKEARSAGAGMLITTAKDAVRLSNLEFSMECFVAEFELQIEDEISFREFICFS